MKKIFLMTLALTAIGSAAHAVPFHHLPEGEYHPIAFQACTGVQGQFLSNGSKSCTASIQACQSDYMKFLEAHCVHVGFSDDPYLDCSDASLANAAAEVKSHGFAIQSACSLVKTQWPSEETQNPIQMLPVTINPVNESGQAEANDEADISQNDGASFNNSNFKIASPTVPAAAPTVEMAAGGGCSLQVVALNEFSWSALMICALIATYSGYLFLRKKK